MAKTLPTLFTIVLCLLPRTAAVAHHGLDFLLVQDAFVPVPGGGAIYGGFDWTEFESQTYNTSESGFMLGILPGLAFGVGLGSSNVSDGWNIHGLTPYLQASLLPKAWSSRVRVALRVGYEISITPYTLNRSIEVREIETIESKETIVEPAVSTRSTNIQDPTPPVPCGPDAGPDAPPCPNPTPPSAKHAGHAKPTRPAAAGKTSTRSTQTTRETISYRNETYERRIEGFNSRLMVEADLTASQRFVANLTHYDIRGEKPAWGYALGLRHAFHHDLAMSIEALGAFNLINDHQALVAIHIAPVHWGLIKLGVSKGLTDESPDWSLITGFVVRF